MNQSETINKIIELAQAEESIIVVWLYGSRAKGTASETSDFDIAIAFDEKSINKVKHQYYCDQLSSDWSSELGVDISVIDINQVPTPLAYNVINDGVVIISKNDFRQHTEQQRVWALWESYRYEYERYRK